jgi:hypothetical protein
MLTKLNYVRLLILVISLLLSIYTAIFAQEAREKVSVFTGRAAQKAVPNITGIVLDKATGEALIGATVVVDSNLLGTQTDMNGKFSLRGLPSGKYKLTFKYIGYKTVIFKEVIVEEAKTLIVNAVLEEEAMALDSIVVEAKVEESSNVALLLAQKNAVQTMDGFSGDMILKETPSFNLSLALRRMPGVSILEDRLIIVRGLSERYNNLMVNQALLPVSELDRSLFDFDVLPSNIISQIRLIKSTTPDLFAELAGSSLQIQTQDIPEKRNLSIILQGNYNSGTTFRRFYTYPATERSLGIFKSVRNLIPDNFPSAQQVQSLPRDSEAAFVIARQLDNNNAIDSIQAPLASMVAVEYQDRFKVGNNTAGFTFFTNYQDRYEIQDYFLQVLGQYDTLLRSGPILDLSTYDRCIRKKGVTSMLNMGMELGNTGKLAFKNLLNYGSEMQAFLSAGTYIDLTRENRAFPYLFTPMRFNNKLLYAGQLLFEKRFLNENNKEKFSISGNLNLSYSLFTEPGYRAGNYYYEDSLGYIYDYGLQGNFVMMLTGRKSETIIGGQLALETPLSNQLRLKSGVFVNTNRDYLKSRYLGLLANFDSMETPIFDIPLSNIRYEDDERIFSSENIRPGGFSILDQTTDYHHYTAGTINIAPFGLIDWRIGSRWRMITGLRVETFLRKIENYPVAINERRNYLSINEPDWLPSLNLIYSVTQRANFRMAIFRTLVRPLVHDLVPNRFVNLTTSFITVGNPEVRRAAAQSVDLRYEFFPTGSEIMSLSLFYKHFSKPMEQAILTNTIDNFQYYFVRNQTNASVAGVEFEIRRNIGLMTEQAYLDNLIFYLNGTLIHSAVNVNNINDFIRPDRYLQGQSPFMINAGILFKEKNTDVDMAVFYNVTGKRIAVVGEGARIFPDFYELPRNVIDFQLSRKINRHFEIRFTISDMLNQPTQWVQIYDNRRNFESDRDQIVRKWRRGTNFFLTLTYNAF